MDSLVIEQPCVDVVIPVFNGRQTILAALNSVLSGQGAWVHRIIVVDDGSIDNTAEIVKSLECPNVELISTPNLGVARARNLGIDKTSAEWIAFLDSDDEWMPGKLDIQLRTAKENGFGFVCASASVDSSILSHQIPPQLLALGNFVATSSVLVKRSVLRQIQPVFTPGMSFAEDYLTWLKCVTLTRGYYISTRLVEYSLSELPHYRWPQIFDNLIALNKEYADFLCQTDKVFRLRFILRSILTLGTLRSLFSIQKRFIKSRLQSRLRKTS
jgi:glycosyltransferase involved in cell wall biosynthesis